MHGNELWKSDGTANGTVMVKDINPGSGGSTPSELINVNGTLFFRCADDGLNQELWKSDGTDTGTVLVKDISSYYGSQIRVYLAVNGILFFTAYDVGMNQELWKSDGTTAGTVMVKDINPSGYGSNPGYLTNINGSIFFSATDGGADGTNSNYELWKTDGTEAGTVLVKDICPGVNGSGPSSLTNVNGTLFFVADDGINGTEIWKSDGTSSGTVLVKDIYSGTSFMYNGPAFLKNVNGILFFNADDGINGPSLWKSDGTELGTVMVKDIFTGTSQFESGPTYLTNVNGTLFFTADDGVNGTELWKSDGTTVGTELVKDINIGSNTSNPTYLTEVKGMLFFSANDGVNGNEMWKSDGTASGTVLVSDINSGVNNSDPLYYFAINKNIFFAANDGVNGSELWSFTLPSKIITVIAPNIIPQNNTVEVNINTDELFTGDGILSYQFDISYDNSKLQYTSANITSTIAQGGTVNVNNSTSGLLKVGFINTTPLIGSGTLVKLQFQSGQVGTCQLVLSNFVYNIDTISNLHNDTINVIGLYGDIDTSGYVQAYDAALALQYSIGIDPLPSTDPRPWDNWRKIVSNVDGVDSVSANDASLILQYSIGLISVFPVENSKSLENPIADITITQNNNELILNSTGELFGLNIYSNNGSNVTMTAPTVLDPNMLSALNIAGNTYNVGLCTAYTPSENTNIMKIPFACTGNETITFNMIINKNSLTKTVNVECTTGVTENKKQSVNIYPNPANDKIEIEGLQNGNIEIINVQGQTVKTLNISNNKTTIDLSKISGGVYTMKIKSDNGIIVKKLIKQ